MSRPGVDRPQHEANEWAVQAAAYDVACRTQSGKAARVVAGRATDAADCRELLAMLGLGAEPERIG
ncbi:hypothetical protein GCM10009836_17150 [Pseudonocardia ailaonensis]|uniref:Uncharacterized protein n=1 Tax=Pseudonocardia ailaonensis TaxID=367279 RepID=A0ABN2MU07_9PSEU